ncbi:unnamed protein product [marine sediment metagenome]|uniref:Uncharacterized protein n=1 Tax=marine sediment metagenome TaxID=412755 RepID=X1LUT4_9ZZZZ
MCNSEAKDKSEPQGVVGVWIGNGSPGPALGWHSHLAGAESNRWRRLPGSDNDL